MQSFDFFKKNWIVFLCFFFLIFLIYGQSLSGDFVYDDRGILEHLETLQNTQNIGQVAMHPYWEKESGLYRPMTLLSYSTNLIFFGNDPFSFHLINLVLYLFICFSIYLLTKRLFNNSFLAFITALLFLVLPIHTEVVANITGRSELLCLFFALLAILEFTKEKTNYWLLGLWTLFSIGSKEIGIALFPIIMILLYQKEQKINLEIIKKYFKEISSVLIGVSFYFFLRFFSLGINKFLDIKTSLIENPLLFTDVLSRWATSLKILWIYFYKTFWPTNLCSDYSYNQIPIIHNWLNIETLLGLLIIAILLVLSLKYLNKKNPISLGAGIFLFSFLPISNIFFPIGTIAGERLFFFPSLGLVLIIAFVIYKILTLDKKKVLKILFFLFLISILTIYGVISFQRQSAWLTEENLFLSAVECAPSSVLSRSNLGAMYLLKGNLDKAEEELKISKEIKPIYSKGLNNLGLVYFKKGENKKALELYYEALQQDYPYSGTLENLVLLYLSEENLTKAKYWLMYIYDGDEELVDNLIKNYLENLKK